MKVSTSDITNKDKSKNKITIIENCGSLYYKEDVNEINKKQNIISFKPDCLKYKVEIDPLTIHKYMIIDLEKNKNKNEKINSTNNGYKQKRRELLTFIQQKSSIFKYKLKSFYLAVSYLDTILLTQNYPNLDQELVALVCLLLAGKKFFL